MDRELADAVRAKVKTQLMDGLLAQNTLDVPKSLIEEEINVMQKEMFGGELSDEKRAELPRKPFEEQAKRRIALGLMLGEVVRSQSARGRPGPGPQESAGYGRQLR